MPAARRDLFDIWVWRGRDYPERGDRLLQQIEKACLKLRRFPALGAPVSRLASDDRRMVINGYSVLYQFDRSTVTIIRVLDQRRLIEAGAFSDD